MSIEKAEKLLQKGFDGVLKMVDQVNEAIHHGKQINPETTDNFTSWMMKLEAEIEEEVKKTKTAAQAEKEIDQLQSKITKLEEEHERDMKEMREERREDRQRIETQTLQILELSKKNEELALEAMVDGDW